MAEQDQITIPVAPWMAAHLACVGAIASAWAALEHDVSTTIWQLANLDHALGNCITASFISVHPKFKAMLALANARGASEKSIKKN